MFVGWVNTRLYAQVIDIFIDSSPFPCGLTLYEAMAAGKAFILWDTPANRKNGVAGFILSAKEGASGTKDDQKTINEILLEPNTEKEQIRISGRNSEEIVALSNLLIQDMHYRKKNGDAGQKIIRVFFQDIRRSGRTLAVQIDESVKQILNHRSFNEEFSCTSRQQ